MESRRRTAAPTGLLTIAVLAVSLLLLSTWIGNLLPSFGNPFREETIDRSGPVLLKSIRNLSEYHAASGHFEVLVDVEKDVTLIPAIIKGERTLFVAVGDVDAGVDFRGLRGEAVDVDEDSERATITLPPAHFFEARVDPERSYVYDRDRGVVDRIASLFKDNPTSEREAYVLAQEKLLEAARHNSGLLARAERNTQLMLESMLRALGFTTVDVRFAREGT